MLHTPLCTLLDIEHPVISAPMAGYANAELAAAVSMAGGFGLIAATQPVWDAGRPSWLRGEIRAVRDLTDPSGSGSSWVFRNVRRCCRSLWKSGSTR
jgi:NAD(P)H-dependent flavin oxidoreductase YrpB (nitropropane dioxygenase family)